jgi:serralysin
MYLDLVALQKMYGKPTDANPGNTKYVYHDNRTYWETVSDSGGRDTVIYDSDTRGGLIDLSNRDFSRMGKPVFFSDGGRTFDTIRFGPSTLIENATGGGGNDRLTGNGARNFLIGNAGNDELTGGAGADQLNGGSGRDRLTGGAGEDTLWWTPGDVCDGGTQRDLLKVTRGDLDLTVLGNSRITGIETIDLSHAGANTLILKASDVLALSSSTDTLRVLGDGADTVDIVGAHADQGVSGAFHRYTLGLATLLVDKDIDVA